jgi:outer membrane protein assembly factor BamB
MGKIGKTFVLSLILIMAVSSLGMQQKPVPLWTYSIQNNAAGYRSLSWSTPTIANGVVYSIMNGVEGEYSNYMPHFFSVYAFDANSGKILWYYNITYGNPVFSCAVAAGIVYAASYQNTLSAFKASNGQELWNFTDGGGNPYALGPGISTSPTVANGMVYVGDGDGNIISLNATSGYKLWNYTVDYGYSIASTPTVANDIVYAGSYDNYLYALNASTGNKIWSFSTGRPISSPTVKGGIVYFGAYDGNVYALNAADGTKIWNYSTGLVASSPVVSNNVVFAYTGRPNEYGDPNQIGQLYALNATDGNKLWNSTIDGYYNQQNSPSFVDGVVYFGSVYGNLYAIHATNGDIIWTYAPGISIFSSPLIANGNIYLGDYGTFYALTSPSEYNAIKTRQTETVLALIAVLAMVLLLAIVIAKKKNAYKKITGRLKKPNSTINAVRSILLVLLIFVAAPYDTYYSI